MLIGITSTTFWKRILCKSTMIKLKDILNEGGRYIGNCVDVGSGNNKEVCSIFSDATSMAQKVGNPDENDWGDSKELSKTEFLSYIDSSKIPAKSVKGNHTHHYIAIDNVGREMTPKQAAIFFIYNEDQDIHYFFRR